MYVKGIELGRLRQDSRRCQFCSIFTGHRHEIEEITYVLRVGLFLFTFCGSIFYIVASFLLLILVGILFCFVFFYLEF